MAADSSKRLCSIVLILAMSVSCATASAAADDYFQIVYDTTEPAIKGMESAFGYAVFIHADGKRILLDTGTEPAVLENNLRAAGIDVATLDLVVMSHNHHDHAGGLERVRELNGKVPVYVPPNQDFDIEDVKVVDDHLEVTPNIHVIRTHTDTPTAGIFDDLSVVLRSRQGPYVLSACSHSGVSNIVDRARQVLGADVYYFSGGARLIGRPAADTTAVANQLQARNVQRVSPSHCSLSHRVDQDIRNALGERVEGSRLGSKVSVVLP